MTSMPSSHVPSTADVQPITLSVAEFERATGLSHTKVAELIAAKRIRSFKVGRRRLIPFAAVEEWIASSLQEADSA